MKPSAFTIEWHDEEGSGFTDLLPADWFDEEGLRHGLTHHVLDAHGDVAAEAKCDVTVGPEYTDLDYSPHSSFNKEQDVLLGILRIVLNQERSRITRALWKGQGNETFVEHPATIRPVLRVSLRNENAPKGIPDGITRDDVLQAFKDFDAGAPHRFGPSTHYDVLDDGERRYPPKAILGLAAKRASGVELGPDDFSGGEKSKCFRVLRSLGFKVVPKPGGLLFPDEVDEDDTHVEGAVSRVTVNRYERDPAAREKCIKHYGMACQVCGFDFAATFGEIGVGFIHVHHLVPLSSIKKGYVVDPVKDLRPVCPNCHAMLHRRAPPFSIEELSQQRR